MNRLRRFLKVLGPGFITGASDDDPSGIGTYSQAGAIFGFGQLWTALFSFPLMVVVQEMCGRIGLVTGKGLAGVIKQHYSTKILYGSVLLLLIANTVNIGADLGAMAAAMQLLLPLHFSFWLILMTALILLLEVLVTYKVYVKYLKYLTLSLFAYVLTAFVIKVDWTHVIVSTLLPNVAFSKEYLMNIVAILGTTISPYLFFWQADEEVEEEIAHHKLRRFGAGIPHVTPKDIRSLRLDTFVGMFFSNIVMWFIIITTGTVLFTNSAHPITSAAEAAEALRPLAGNFAYFLFAAGIIGTGFLAVPILSGSASYAVSEAFHWNTGLYLKLRKAHGFYGVITLATLFGFLINFIGINPISALYYTAVLNGFIAPPLLVLILLIANNKKIIGERINSPLQNGIGVLTIVIMSLSAIALIYQLVVH